MQNPEGYETKKTCWLPKTALGQWFMTVLKNIKTRKEYVVFTANKPTTSAELKTPEWDGSEPYNM